MSRTRSEEPLTTSLSPQAAAFWPTCCGIPLPCRATVAAAAPGCAGEMGLVTVHSQGHVWHARSNHARSRTFERFLLAKLRLRLLRLLHLPLIECRSASGFSQQQHRRVIARKLVTDALVLGHAIRTQLADPIDEAVRVVRDGCLHGAHARRRDRREICEHTEVALHHLFKRHEHVRVVGPRPPVQRPQHALLLVKEDGDATARERIQYRLSRGVVTGGL